MRRFDKNIYIDAMSLIPINKSGVGYSLEQTLKELTKLSDVQHKYIINLVVTFGKAKHLRQYCSPGVKVRTIYLPARLMEILLRLNIFPPMDWLLGSGVYVFPNYRNWPLWGSRSITYIYDVSFKRFPGMVRPNNQRYLSRYVTRWVSRTDRIVTISEQVKEEIEKYLCVIFTMVDIVYCGVDTETFHSTSKSVSDVAKQKYAIPYDKYLLYVGNVEPRKNLVRLIEAYRALPEDLRQTYGLVIIGGDGWLNESFFNALEQAQVEGEKILKVSSYVATSDLPALYSAATVLVHPAVYEGFGITPLEAMACKTLVAVSDLPAIREVVGDAGFYFDPYDALSIARAISDAIKSDPPAVRRRIKQGLAKAEKFSWVESALALSRVIDAQINRGPQRRPIIRRMKYAYSILDRFIRELLGERVLQPYRPSEASTVAQFREGVYTDFLNEQPSHAQFQLLRVYLGGKHRAVQAFKRAYTQARPKKA